MERLETFFGRLMVTLVLVVIATVVGWQLWVYYMDLPWTRDGRVRADVVQVAPDVSGLVSHVLVRDNQVVKTGDVLFQIDEARFRLALREAEATLAASAAASEEAAREAHRAVTLDADAIAIQSQQQYAAKAAEALAAYQQALAARDVARLNLERSTVRASVSGPVTNFGMRPGDYVTAGTPVFALIDTGSLYVVGYFQETKLSGVEVGDPVRVQLMGERRWVEGHVESIAGGITDRELTRSPSLLADVSPTFSWVRLAQRIPVRVAIDKVPQGMRLIAGRTASVEVMTQARR